MPVMRHPEIQKGGTLSEMERLSINLPEKFDFTTEIQVQLKDLNFVDHVGNNSLISYVNEISIRFLTTKKIEIR